jgi:Ni,Fe-hydrogenase I cytochrome b subunit
MGQYNPIRPSTNTFHRTHTSLSAFKGLALYSTQAALAVLSPNFKVQLFVYFMNNVRMKGYLEDRPLWHIMTWSILSFFVRKWSTTLQYNSETFG